MTGRFRIVVFAMCLSLLTVAEVRFAVAAEPLDRTKQQAIALFRSVIEEKAGELGRCSLAPNWIEYPIPEELARRYLGLKLHAALAPSHPTARATEVIDPDGEMTEVFCDDAESASQRDALVKSFQNGALEAQKEPFKLDQWLKFRQFQYSFPVFDGAYRRAVIVSAGSSYNWVKVSEGEVRFIDVHGGASALLYIRRDGAWRRSAEETLYTFN